MYALINFIVLGIAGFLCFLPIKKEKRDNLCLIIIGFLLIFISGFRGNFTPDYGNYDHIFRVIQTKSVKELLMGDINVEIGYALFNKLISFFTTNYTVLLVVLSSIIVIIYFVKFKKNSPYPWLSILLLLNFGSYYTSFNTLRQFLVCALFILAFEYIYKENFLRYFIAVLCLFFVHKSAILMIPFYFILRIRWNKVKNLLMITFFFFFYCVFLFFQDYFVSLITTVFYKNYSLSDAFGIDTGVPILSILRPLVILAFLLILSSKINFEDKKELVWFNSSVLLFLISLLSVNIEMFQRFTYYFLPYMTFQIPVIISRVSDKKMRVFLIVIIMIIILSYSFLTNENSVYFFVWDN
ncbi:EpsG family protein [Vagococcus fluvialis]|uniref:EpsG family protein n=1 Tax=Vagococcus fluvialis TaxID=2738 RepID=UPI0020337712|nr:EpsG family protein [Vagococcus fluvialis]MCM2138011.1 EpsG family protein [Vagococcus fluvialis]